MSFLNQWYYRQPNAPPEAKEGPVSEPELAALIRAGVIHSRTELSSPQLTNNAWLPFPKTDVTEMLAEFDAARLQQEEKKPATERTSLLEDVVSFSLKDPPPRPESLSPNKDRMSGLELIVIGGVLGCLGWLLLFIGFGAIAKELLTGVATIVSTVAGLFLLAGTIRWGVQPLIDAEEARRERRESRRSRRRRRKREARRKPVV